MIAQATVTRRNFLVSSAAATGGLLIGVYVPAFAGPAAQKRTKGTAFAPNAFVRIAPDETVTIIVGKSEMGQGVYTSLPMLVADELDADWKRVRVQAAPVDAAYNHTAFGIQMTGGSTSVWSSYDQLRKAGAMARAMLIAAAAQQWKVDPASCATENGSVVHRPSKRRISYGRLAEAASRMKPPTEFPLKDPKDFKFIGKPMRRLDTPEKSDGSGIFGIDVKVPGMLTALIARPPVFGAKLKSFDATKAKAVRGVKDVVQFERGVAVLADGFWPASLGRDALQITWDEGPLADFSSERQRQQYAELAKQPGIVAKQAGNADQALASAAKRVEAIYEVPYLSHAMMEPLNCVVDLRAGGCEIWTGTQFQTVDRAAAAQVAGLKPEQVKIHTTLLGGGFGRRANPVSDFVVEAVQLAKIAGAPVKVIWTREDDMHGGYYRPMYLHSFTGAVDGPGNIIGWKHRIVGQSIIEGTPFEKAMVKDGIDESSVEGASNLPYEVPNLLVDYHKVTLGIPVLWWRSVGHSHTAFVTESFFDELATVAGKDPYELRRALLAKHPRHRRVLELAAEKAGWGAKPPEGRGRGIAVHESFGSFIAQVAEVSVSRQGEVRVHRVVCAIDCGPIVNPDTIKAQMEGGIIFGLTAALYGELTFEKGRVQQSNFHDYKMLRINETPEIEVHIVPSQEKQGGVGEPGVPPIAPAVTNAVFALTGKRIRKLPIRPADLATA